MTAERRAAADQRWRTAVLAIGGLLIAIAVIGVVGILINRNIHQTVEDAIAFDVELEDRGDDLRVAILEVRHYHRDLLLNNPDPTRVDLWQDRYRVLTDEIAAVERLIEPQKQSLARLNQMGLTTIVGRASPLTVSVLRDGITQSFSLPALLARTVRAVVALVRLQSPSFLYRIEIPATGDGVATGDAVCDCTVLGVGCGLA